MGRVPVIRAKARPRKPVEAERPQAPPRSKSHARSATETEVIPVPMNGRAGRSRSRPPRPEPETPVLMDVARAAAALGEDSDVDVIPQVTKRKPRAPKKPVVKATRGNIVIDREAIRSQIQRVRVASAVPPRGRGRPPGSLNKATHARLQPAV